MDFARRAETPLFVALLACVAAVAVVTAFILRAADASAAALGLSAAGLVLLTAGAILILERATRGEPVDAAEGDALQKMRRATFTQLAELDQERQRLISVLAEMTPRDPSVRSRAATEGAVEGARERAADPSPTDT